MNKQLKEMNKEEILENIDNYIVSGETLKNIDKKFHSDKEIVLRVMQKDGLSLKYIQGDLLKDKEINMAAVKNDSSAIRYVIDYFLPFDKNRDIIFESIKKDSTLEAFNHLKKYILMDEEFNFDIYYLAKEKQLQYLLDWFENSSFSKTKKEFIKNLHENSVSKEDFFKNIKKRKKLGFNILRFASDEIMSDKNLILEYLSYFDSYIAYEKRILQDFSLEQRNDKQIVNKIIDLYLCRYCIDDLGEFIGEKLKEDEALMLKISIEHEDNIKYISKKLMSKKSFVEKLLAQYPKVSVFENISLHNIKFIGENLKNDKDMILKIIAVCPKYIENIDKCLMEDIDFVTEAIEYQADIYKSLNDEMKLNKELFMKAIEKNMWLISDAPNNIKKDRTVALYIVKHAPKKFSKIKEYFSCDKEIVLEALKYPNIEYVCETLKRDKEVILRAIDGAYNKTLKFIQEISRKVQDVIYDTYYNSIIRHAGEYGIYLNQCCEYFKEDTALILHAKKQYQNLIEQISIRFNHRVAHVIRDLKDEKRKRDLRGQTGDILTYIPEEILNPNPQDDMSMKKEMDLLELMQYYDKSISSGLMKNQKIDNFGNRLREFIKEGFTLFELIKFFKKYIKVDLTANIKRQWEDAWDKPVEGKTYIECEGEAKAYLACEMSIIVEKFKPYFNLKDEDEFVLSAKNCESFFVQNANKPFDKRFNNTFLTEQRIASLKDKRLDDCRALFSQLGIPEEFVEGRERNIKALKELLTYLKERWDFGFSLKFIRLLTMGGYHADETDYLKLYKKDIEEGYKKAEITEDEYKFFKRLFKIKNPDRFTLGQKEHQVFWFIREAHY